MSGGWRLNGVLSTGRLQKNKRGEKKIGRGHCQKTKKQGTPEPFLRCREQSRCYAQCRGGGSVTRTCQKPGNSKGGSMAFPGQRSGTPEPEQRDPDNEGPKGRHRKKPFLHHARLTSEKNCLAMEKRCQGGWASVNVT